MDEWVANRACLDAFDFFLSSATCCLAFLVQLFREKNDVSKNGSYPGA